jgi:hypothetical protein
LFQHREPAGSVRNAQPLGELGLVLMEFWRLDQRVQAGSGGLAGPGRVAFEFEDELFQSAHAVYFSLFARVFSP